MTQTKQPKNRNKGLFTTQPLKLSSDLRKSPFSIPYEQYNLTPIKIVDIYHNRHQLKVHGHKRAGIYLWLTPNFCYRKSKGPKGFKKMYVGRSINLYARVRSYFYRIPKYKGASLIRNYLNKYGFSGVNLILFILPKKYTFNELVNVEQAFLDFFKPALNLDSNATPSRYNAPMKSETYKKFVSQRSHAIGVFNGATNKLLWVFELLPLLLQRQKQRSH